MMKIKVLKKINRYYLYSEGLINENDENILKAKDCEHFIIKELKEINTDEEKKKMILLKLKIFSTHYYINIQIYQKMILNYINSII